MDTRVLFTARKIEDTTGEYRELEQWGLTVEQRCLGGTGNYDDPYRMEFFVKNTDAMPWEGVLQIEMARTATNPRFFLPGFMYGRNRGESPQNTPVQFPRIRKGQCTKPSSSWWMVRGDRLACPVALVYDEGTVFGFAASPYWIRTQEGKVQYRKEPGEFYRYAGYSCRLQEECRVGYTVGYENAPWLFVEARDVRDRAALSEENCVLLYPGETLRVSMEVYEYKASGETGIHEAIRTVYTQYHEPPRKLLAAGQSMTQRVEEAIRDLSVAVYEDAWLEEKKQYSGFVYGKEDPSEFRYNEIGSLTWTNGLSVAVPILLSALRLNHEKMRMQALTCIQTMVDNCMNPKSGLPFDAVTDGVWSVRGWWFDGMHTPGHAGYLVGQAMYYILKAYAYEKEKRQVVHEDWLSFVRPVLERVEKEKNSEAEYPFVFSGETGAGLEYGAFGGAWCMAAVAYYTWLTKENGFLAGLVQSEEHYYKHYVSKVECYGAPLDTEKAVDSEGILAYIRAVRYLHMVTGEAKYLEHMKDALEYEFTFKFCYNSPVKVPPLCTIGWSSCGGSITSTCNPHIHPMSSTIVGELKYYYEQTKDEYVKARTEDVIWWGCQTYNTYAGEYGYGKKGWMSERFCYCEGLVKERYPDGTLAGTWFALMPWASGSILEGLVETL